MSRDPSDHDWLEQELESARRRVNQLEIDACRIRTDLAVLEAANATGAAPPLAEPVVERSAVERAPEQSLDWQPVADQLPAGMELLVGEPSVAQVPPEAPVPEQSINDLPPLAAESWASTIVSRSRKAYRRVTSPMMASLSVHALVIFAALSITVVTIEQHDAGSMTTTLVLGDKPANEPESFDTHTLADLGETGVQTVAAELPIFEAVGPIEHVPIPIDFEPIENAGLPGEMGLTKTEDTDLGDVPSGAGGLATSGTGTGAGSGGGKAGGAPKTPRGASRADSTMFFGTAARGNRFVFIVDNSSSMKGGRLDLAVAELIRTVEGLSPRQSFYVIFVSDKVYPLFFPEREPAMVPATPANKKRLAEWAPRAALASGKNRELIKAMDLAASMQPQAVYLLWDGDLKYSETVRLDVLTHLTQPNQWNFIVHTLGLGLTSVNSEQNLRMIAQAHHGTFRRIDVPGSRAR